MKKELLLGILLAAASATASCAQDAPPDAAPGPAPGEQQAHAAIVAMFGGASELEGTTVKLGTCLPALAPEHAGQIACTFALASAGGSSESQADFHWDGRRWVAQPSSSQEILPFPDSKLSQ
ncbi:hypothetical protein [Pseudoxanthomonas putridarboris]|uniref:Lipoprotein n=1 Tax=Pseudoxanthomonas putridarboris TaxID=752605 RepID=A0ABU9IX22_9GAMM